MVFTNHETRITNHGLFIACFDRRVVRHAGCSTRPIRPAWHEDSEAQSVRVTDQVFQGFHLP